MDSGKPSSTAIFVANGVWWVSLQKQLGNAVPEAFAKSNCLMVECLNQGMFSPRSLIGGWLLRARTRIMQTASIPGFYLHFVCRKREIEAMVREAIRDGVEQLVIIGAGFDTLSLRVSADFPSLAVIEIDHPATQSWKRKAIPDSAMERGNLSLLPLDLTQGTLQNTLLGSSCYRASRQTIFVAEGLLMYLQAPAVKELLGFTKTHSAPGSKLAFTYMEEQAPGNFQFSGASWFVNLWLNIKKEKFTWGLRNAQVGDFLNRCGLQLLTIKTHEDLRREFLPHLPQNTNLARGENIAVAGTGKSPLNVDVVPS